MMRIPCRKRCLGYIFLHLAAIEAFWWLVKFNHASHAMEYLAMPTCELACRVTVCRLTWPSSDAATPLRWQGQADQSKAKILWTVIRLQNIFIDISSLHASQVWYHIHPAHLEATYTTSSVSLTALAEEEVFAMNRGPPPPGGDQNKAPVLIITHAILTGLAVITVAVRFTARTKGGKHFEWDDWTMLVALVRPFSTRISPLRNNSGYWECDSLSR